MSSSLDGREQQLQRESTMSPWAWLDLLWRWVLMHFSAPDGGEEYPQRALTESMWRSFIELCMGIWISMRPRRFSTGELEEQAQHGSTVSLSNSLTNSIPMPSVFACDLEQVQGDGESSRPGIYVQDGDSSDSVAHADGNQEMDITSTSILVSSVCDTETVQEQGKDQALQPANLPREWYSSSGSEMQIDENEGLVITSIRATDVALGLRRLPAGFYTAVHHGGLEWRTENKPSSVSHDVVEWTVPVPLPLALSDIVRLEVYATFEFQPMLGSGEQLRKLSLTVEQLLDRSARDISFVFFPKDEDVISPCSSVFVTVERRKCDLLASDVLRPYFSTAGSQGGLEEATNQGHNSLSRYRKGGAGCDLERSIEHFEHALRVCPVDHPCRAAAQSNLAMVRFILCQVQDVDALCCLELYHTVLDARPPGHADRACTLIQLAAVHIARFERSWGRLEGQQVEELLHEAMILSAADSHQNRAAVFMLQLYAARRMDAVRLDGQSSTEQDSTSRPTDGDLLTLSVQLLHSFERSGNLADLEQAISVLKDLIGSTSVWDGQYCAGLGNLGTTLCYRFERLGELRDLEDAISAQREAVDLTPDGHPDKPGHLSDLGCSFVTRFLRLGELKNLEDGILAQRHAVDLTPHGHLDKPSYLNNLGNSFVTRFRRLGEQKDLEDAILAQRNAVDLTPRSHPDAPDYLSNLCISFKTRFERLGELKDLEDAISAQREAIDLTPHGHPHEPDRLNNLGVFLFTRFRHFGELKDIEDAISAQRNAIDLTPHDHPDKPDRLDNLGNSFHARFLRLGELKDLEDAISAQRDVVNLTPNSHPHKPGHLNNLCNSLLARFMRFGELNDLEDAISAQKDAVDLTPRGHPDIPRRLNGLGNCFLTRFRCLGQLSDLEDAISAQRDAVDFTPRGHPDMPDRLSNLGSSFLARFERLGELKDLEDAISAQRDATNLTPRGHPDMPGCLNNFGTSLKTRFERFGELKDLEDAISAQRDAVNLTPRDHPDMPGRLNNLGNSFKARFERLGEPKDLEDAISALRDAAYFTPHGHSNKPSLLNNVGTSLFTRFDQFGELRDLEDAISAQRDAVNLTPQGHPDMPSHLNNLGNSIRTRFQCIRELRDLEDAISAQKDAIDLTPRDHPDKPSYLNNLGTSFVTRFQHLGELRDLESGILAQREAVDLTLHGHPHKPDRLNNLGISYSIRFERCGELRDLEDAISVLRHAVNLSPHGHRDRSKFLNNLGTSLVSRFERLGELKDLEGAISAQRSAIDLSPRGHPDKITILNNLGNSFFTRFEHLRVISDLERALSLYSHAASASFGPIRTRFGASQKWISCARRMHHRSLLHAFSVAICLLPQLAWIGFSLEHRFSELTRGANIVREAVAAALDAGLPETAAEWLERGRSVVWEELFQLRSSYEELSAAHPDRAHRLRELSAALEQASTAREQSLSALSEGTQSAASRGPDSLQQQSDRHRALAIERDELLKAIRKLPGFEGFLLHKPFSQLRASAHPGPVVLLNAAKDRCDAMVILANVDHVIHIPLPAFTLKRSADLRSMMKHFIRSAREGQGVVWDDVSWASLLSPLWKCVIKPVLDAMAFSTFGDLSRIFWCPSGAFAFLPIHAAGLYDDQYASPGHKVFDFVVSSYVPTLTVLAPPSNPVVVSNDNLRLVVVRQPPSDGLPYLRGVVTESDHIRSIVDNSPLACTTHVESSVGTVEEVLDLLKEADWCHFACHGVQDGLDSGLCLAGERRLNVRNIVALSRPRGGLAFLSACQTATGEEHLSDEAIHIAAGMLFAGYGGVIGTTWSISDSLAPEVAREVYEYLFRNGTKPDHREAARALHEAIARVRKSGASFDEWVPFIHVGL